MNIQGPASATRAPLTGWCTSVASTRRSRRRPSTTRSRPRPRTCSSSRNPERHVTHPATNYKGAAADHEIPRGAELQAATVVNQYCSELIWKFRRMPHAQMHGQPENILLPVPSSGCTHTYTRPIIVDVPWSVCVCVFLVETSVSHAKRMSWSRCRLGCRLTWAGTKNRVLDLGIDVKNVQIKIKNVKNVKTWQKKLKNVCNTLPLLSVVQLHALCPRNGLQGNSAYAIQFSFAEIVVVLG